MGQILYFNLFYQEKYICSISPHILCVEKWRIWSSNLGPCI